jgi:hypothetical protein
LRNLDQIKFASFGLEFFFHSHILDKPPFIFQLL